MFFRSGGVQAITPVQCAITTMCGYEIFFTLPHCCEKLINLPVVEAFNRKVSALFREAFMLGVLRMRGAKLYGYLHLLSDAFAMREDIFGV